MKISNIVLLTVLAITSQSAFAGGTVGSDQVTIQSLSSLDCRVGDNYWSTNKGIYLNLSEMTAFSYKDNGHTEGDKESIQCSAKNKSLRCQGNGFILTIPNVSKIREQQSSDFGDALGAMVGVGPKNITVTKGTLEAEGLIFDSEKPVVCAISQKLNYN